MWIALRSLLLLLYDENSQGQDLRWTNRISVRQTRRLIAGEHANTITEQRFDNGVRTVLLLQNDIYTFRIRLFPGLVCI